VLENKVTEKRKLSRIKGISSEKSYVEKATNKRPQFAFLSSQADISF